MDPTMIGEMQGGPTTPIDHYIDVRVCASWMLTIILLSFAFGNFI
jgi:hypothetical protein